GQAIVEVLNKVKPPDNISQSTQELVLKALEEVGQVNDMIRILVQLRERLAADLAVLPVVRKVYPSDANFLLIKTENARGIYEYLLHAGIVVRDRSKVELCAGCLRITVGTEEENQELLMALKQFGPTAQRP
ncbi:MAG TPA: aminotransferase class I/II-fold pyridoxal phosphate-dependent enzyme, partial [Puia sp.]|nr:aminotransferase class I/II-fold pyridoxal phosphate-dependent enzyme [Puia sp.]